MSLIFNNLTFVLGILASISVVYNMLAVLIFKEQVFFDHVVSMQFEFLILMGTVFILLFDIISIGWVSHKIHVAKKSSGLDKAALSLGVLCLLALMISKVMADEISREYLLGWETLGEWIILYLCFFIQFFYNIFIFILLRRPFPPQRSP
jgi:hypothetical protein